MLALSTSGDVVCLEGDVNIITIAGIDLDDFLKQAVTIDEDGSNSRT